MIITNRKGLPAALVAACQNDPYDPGDADISITRLIAPPRQVALMKQHAAELTSDVADRIWALRSQGIHAILERAVSGTPERDKLVIAINSLGNAMESLGVDPDDTDHPLLQAKAELRYQLGRLDPPPVIPNEIAEVRWERECLGWRVSGKLDLVSLADGVLTDWKDTSVWAIKDALDPKTTGKVEWEQQTNLLAYFGRPHGYTIRAVQVVAFGRDWRKNEKLRYGDEYPDAEVSVIPLPLWSEEKAQTFLERRVKMHQGAQLALDAITGQAPGGPYPFPECTPEERWEQPTIYAVCKVGNKTATRLYGDRALADQHAASQPNLEVRVRPGVSPRCAQYCDALRWCAQGQKLVATEPVGA